jgi:serine/threonine protein kinase
MSPELHNATPLMVFSAKLIEMLSGKPLIKESDPYRAIYRVIHEQLALPKDFSADIDDQLRAIMLRAIARDPMQRHPSSKIFRDELVKWLEIVARPKRRFICSGKQ